MRWGTVKQFLVQQYSTGTVVTYVVYLLLACKLYIVTRFVECKDLVYHPILDSFVCFFAVDFIAPFYGRVF